MNIEEEILKIVCDDWTSQREKTDKLLILFGVSGSLVDDAILDYDLAIKRDLPNTFEPLRDHGTHVDFCKKLNDIRNKVRENYR